MGIAAMITRWLERRLSGGSMEDYAALPFDAASDFDLPHQDRLLESRIARSLGGRPFDSWSLRGKDLQDVRTAQGLRRAVADATRTPLEEMAFGAAVRWTPEIPLGTVQAMRFGGASEAAIRAALPAGGETRDVAGVRVARTEVEVLTMPDLTWQGAGWRWIVDDMLFELQDPTGPDGSWLAEAVDQSLNGWRNVAPSIGFDLPGGWVGGQVGAVSLRALADRLAPGATDRARGLRSAADLIDGYDPHVTFVAFAEGASAGSLVVGEFEGSHGSPTDDMDAWLADWKAEFQDARLDRLDLPAGPAARLSYTLADSAGLRFAQPWIVRIGATTYRLEFATNLERREMDEPVFEAIARGLRPRPSAPRQGPTDV